MRILIKSRVSAPHLFRVLLHALLHPERRVAGPDGVIFVRERRAEERHDPVAHDLVDGALVAVNGVHHPLQDGIEDPACLFGIAVGEQLHRALEVREEHSDLLALAFEGGLRREDAFGEVLGGVGLRRCEACRLDPVTIGRLPAFEAELGANRQLGAALDAGDGELGSALQTELRLRRVVLTTLWTLHRRAA